MVNGGCRAGELIVKSSDGAGELSGGYQVLTRVVRLPSVDIYSIEYYCSILELAAILLRPVLPLCPFTLVGIEISNFNF